MKKLSNLLLFIAFFTAFGCKKDVEISKSNTTSIVSPNMDLAKNGDPSLHFSSLNAKVKVENGRVFAKTSLFMIKQPQIVIGNSRVIAFRSARDSLSVPQECRRAVSLSALAAVPALRRTG